MIAKHFFSLIVCVAGVSIASGADLPVRVKNALGYRQVPDNALSVYVEDLSSGDVVLNWHESEPRNPASVEKMVTTLVALDKLGPAYRWKTEVSFLGEVSNGTLEGDLAIKGYGDPYLVTERFWQLLRDVRREGISRISGDLLIDDSFFRRG